MPVTSGKKRSFPEISSYYTDLTGILHFVPTCQIGEFPEIFFPKEKRQGFYTLSFLAFKKCDPFL